jgi:hypothetical protein
MNKRLILLLLLSFSIATAVAAPAPPATNKDGSIVTGVLTAGYDPTIQLVPTPTNLFFLLPGSFDLTLNPPPLRDDPNDFSDPLVALGAKDGFSTTEKWVTEFFGYPDPDFTGIIRPPGQIDPASVIPGHSVRVFQVTTSNIVFVTGVVRELVPYVDFVALAATESILAIIPLKPLPELSSFMAVLTNDIKDTSGNDATADSFYHLTQRRTPWVDENGKSTYPLVPDASAQALEPQRQITNTMEAAAEAAGVIRDDIILSWTVQTQSITVVTKALRSIAQPGGTTIVDTGMTTADLGLFGLADIYMGIITMPYYLGVPDTESPLAPLTDFWTASPGAYVPPFDQFGLDPTSTNVTYANPFPVLTDMQTVPVLMTVPNEAATGFSKPTAGWPTVIFTHGFNGNRTQMLAVADTIASMGFAVIAIDAPLHGVVPEVEPALAPFYIGNTPFAPIANERTFDVDYIDNSTGAPPRDGIPDPSGRHYLNLTSLLTTQDNLRQMEVDLSILALTIPTVDINGDSLPDLDGADIALAGFSLGSIVGIPFMAVEPTVNRGFLSVPMGGLARGYEASDTFGPAIRAGLEAAAGIVPGTAEYELYFTVFQTIVDSADPINWAADLALSNSAVVHEVIGDTIVPNLVPPLSGTEPLMAVMGLKSYSTTQSNPAGVHLAGRFIPPAWHGSLLDPSVSPAATAEMQAQLASFLTSRGQVVVVMNPATMVPVPEGEADAGAAEQVRLSKAVTAKSERKPAKGKNQAKSLKRNEE